MRIRISSLIMACAVFTLMSSILQAGTITFGTSDIDRLDLAGPQTEGDFVFNATNGEGWELQTTFGNPDAALTTFFNDEGALVGDTVEFTKSGGGFFTFDSVDFRTIASSGSDDIIFEGFSGGSLTESLLLDFSTTTFTTILSGFTAPIDLLTLTVVAEGNNAALVDNVVLSPTNAPVVPEPTSFAIFALGVIGCGVVRRRRN